jgi:hypothetical protein
MSFLCVLPGDKVTRNMAGIIMELTVESVTEDRIITAGGWEFCRRTGVEIDDYLGWGPQYGVTGSFLVRR